MDRFTMERKEMTKQLQEIESQLEWLRSQRDEEIAKLIVEKKLFQERFHGADTQLSQLKSRKHDELKVLCGMIESIGAAGLDCIILNVVMMLIILKVLTKLGSPRMW
ncbi:hypothetical protein L1887_09747 [Cichorium endivia]|nr:hypothetical protein L1887_09747 [Cichorium endivia]